MNDHNEPTITTLEALSAIGRFVANSPTTRKYAIKSRKPPKLKPYEPVFDSIDVDVNALYNDIQTMMDGNLPDTLPDDARTVLEEDLKLIQLHVTKKVDDKVAAFLLLKEAS